MNQQSPVSLSYRLVVSPERWARLHHLPASPLFHHVAKWLDTQTASWVKDRQIPVDETEHGWHLLRAREVQRRVFSLLVQYGRTGEKCFRETAFDYVRTMNGWTHWCNLAWRMHIADLECFESFDLTCGETSLTLAMLYDWLADELTDEERAMIIQVARERIFPAYLKTNDNPDYISWYYGKADSNWNTVCNGGAGILALALGDLCPQSARVLEVAEAGIAPYFERMSEDGAWPEGIGYWGYGHRYGFLYLLGHERATGQHHPLLDLPACRNTQRFPILFSPNNVPAGFGDSNWFFPLAFQYLTAERYGLWDVAAELDRRILHLLEVEPIHFLDPWHHPWPTLAELLLYHPGDFPEARAVYDWPTVSIQLGTEWGYLADQWPAPRIYASVRGGTTDAPHTHQDLSSVTIVLGAEPMLENIGGNEYYPTTFGTQHHELYENSATSKNVLLLNGVGLPQPSTVKSAVIHGDGWDGIQLDMTEAVSAGNAAVACGRTVIMLAKAAILVLDRVVFKQAGLAESRFHTYQTVTSRQESALITGQQETLHLAFAANVPGQLLHSQGLPTHCTQAPDTILRWCTKQLHHNILLATLCAPNGQGTITVTDETRTIHAAGDNFDITLCYAPDSLQIHTAIDTQVPFAVR